DALDVARMTQVILLDGTDRLVVAAAAFELANRFERRLALARKVHVGHRVKRIVDGDQIGRGQLADEREQGLDDAQLAEPLHVVARRPACARRLLPRFGAVNLPRLGAINLPRLGAVNLGRFGEPHGARDQYADRDGESAYGASPGRASPGRASPGRASPGSV